VIQDVKAFKIENVSDGEGCEIEYNTRLKRLLNFICDDVTVKID
jgi:hypothetical protein